LLGRNLRWAHPHVPCAFLDGPSPNIKWVIIPQVDARLWTHYHTTTWPHHLTKTIMY